MPRSTDKKLRRLETAFRELLLALGHEPRGELAGTPKRAAELWTGRLLAGERLDAGKLLGRAMPSRARAPVLLTGLGVHLVCPHHLTVALGEASVAYAPGGRIAGFGAITRLVEALGARLVLQEEVTREIAEALLEHLGARAALVRLEAAHPCQGVLHARAHGARVVTVEGVGDAGELRKLERMMAKR